MKPIVTKGWTPYLFLLIVVLLTVSTNISAQISITTTGPSYSENFDGMGPSGTSYLTGWTGIRYAGTGTIGAVLNPVPDYGSLNSGAVYNAGPSGGSDRSLGMLASGSTVPRIGAQFINNTGVTITTINMAGLIKQWRSGSSSSVNEIDTFAISFDATSLTTGTWTNVSGMNLTEILTGSTSAGAVDGTAAANQASISTSLTGLTWANGSTMWIRWSDKDDAGSDAELAIDNLSMSFNVAAPVYGKGTASVVPATAQGAITQSLKVVVRGQSPATLTNTNVIVPSIFSWSQSTGDIMLTGGGSPSVTIAGDTIKVSGMTVTGTDSIQIAINNITPPDSTDTFIFQTQTGTQPDSIFNLSTQPTVLVYGTPHAIGDIKTNDVNGVPIWQGKWVTILGVVTVGAEFGSPSYVQDATGGIAVYGVITSGQISIGDEVEIVGLVSPFNGLNELGTPTIIRKVSSGNVVTPILVNCGQVNNDGAGGVEQYEGMLVRINQVIVTSLNGSSIPNWTVSGSGTNYRLQDASDTLEVRVDNNVNYNGDPAPQGTFDIIGVVSQYKTSSPFIGGYQLMPRSRADILAQGPIFATTPVESNLQPTSMHISWTTINNGTTRVRYGLTTAYELGIIAPDNTLGLTHGLDMTSLTPATIYHVQAFTDDGANDTSYAGDLVVSSASPPASAGQMNVYFNFSVNTSVALGENALGNQDLVSKILTHIDNARRSIDLALYSLSGAGYGDVVASHLIAARNRGVSVRVICDHANRSYSGFQLLLNNSVPLIDNAFDAVWNAGGLMHNKFFVFDARGGAPESVWVWGGSWNPTNPGTTQDHQNSIEIQDQALAGAYIMEFNQMWGSSTDVPNAATTRFGARKLDITPHNFLINGIPVSSYFSPSDHTTNHITDMISKAQHSVATCILTFTRADIADTMLARKNAGDKVRIVVDNNTDQGTQVPFLQSNGVDIHLKGFSTGLLHHKYTTIDADQPAGTSYLETGSHNYSSAAENSNDENALILQSKRIANLYLQEFAARYYEAGGTDSIHVASGASFSISRASINYDTVLTPLSKVDSFTVSNSGNIALVIAPIQISDTQFTVQPESASIAASGNQKFYVTFKPAHIGVQAGNLVLSFNASGSPDTVTLSGVGVQGIHPVFSVVPTTINFGLHPIGSSTTDTMIISNPGALTLHIASLASNNSLFTVSPSSDSVIASGSKQFFVTFAPIFSGLDTARILITHDAVSSPDSVIVRGVAIDTPVSKIVAVSGGWNMVSLPLQVNDAKRQTVFPTSTSRAFAYGTSYFVSPNDSLVVGSGYWVKFDTMQQQPMTGLPVWSDSIHVLRGWNLIGSISSPFPVSEIGSSPDNIIMVPFYKFNGSYDTADTIYPGSAYWMRATQVGTIFLEQAPGPKVAPKKVAVSSTDQLNQLVITDATGKTRTLYFGEGKTDPASLSVYDLPPVPPVEAFDVRYASGRYAEFLPHKIEKNMMFPIHLQSMKYPVHVRWTIGSKDTKEYTLSVNGNDAHGGQRLAHAGEMVLTTPPNESFTLIATNNLPTHYALDQNYPNPFNPSTTIQFAVPQSSLMTLKIYNTLGENVATLLNAAPYDAGTYTMSFDGSRLASGVYYYHLIATRDAKNEFQQVRKFLLIK
jgi:hypothetical protein